MIEQIIVTPKVGTIHTTLLTAGKYCEKDIFVDLYPLVAHEQEIAIAAGINQGKTEGKEEAYNAFWDAFQNFGNRTDYDRAFKGEGWNEATYNPKYIPKPVNASFMYQQSRVVGRVEVDTSNCTAMDGLFGNSKSITSIGTVDASYISPDGKSITQLAGVFGYMDKLENIDLLILKDDGSQTFSTSCFFGDGKLNEIRIQGKIGNDLNMRQCYRLSKESLTSIVNALDGDIQGKTLTLSQYVQNNTNIANGITGAELRELAATKPNWTISLV